MGQETPSRAPLTVKPMLFFTLAFLTMASALATDMYLSGFPAMQRDLGTNQVSIQLTLSAFMVGMALGQLFWGPLSDNRGRRGPLRIAMALYIVTGVCAALAPNVWVLIALRFLQGFSGSAGLVIARAIARDLAGGIQLAKLLSLMGVVMGIAPIAAPIVGGLLINVIGWRGVLWCVAGIGSVMAICTYAVIPETLATVNRTSGGFRSQLASLRTVVRDVPFLGYAASALFGFAAVFSYISCSSVLLQVTYGLSGVQFAVCFGINALGMVVLGFANSRLVFRFSPRRLLMVAQIVMIVGTGTLVVVSSVVVQVPLVALVPMVFVSTAVNPLIVANTNTLALTRHGKGAGMASALLGCVQFAGAAAVAPLIAAVGAVSVHTMATVMLVCAVLSAAGGVLYRTHDRVDKTALGHITRGS